MLTCLRCETRLLRDFDLEYGESISNVFNCVKISVHFNSACFAPGGDVEMLDRLSVEVLRIGVEVRLGSRVFPFCPLCLFGVFCKELTADRLTTAFSPPGTMSDSSVAGDETAPVVSL